MSRQAKKPPQTDEKQPYIVSIRLNPRLKFGADLAARAQHNSLSGFAEWAIAKALREVTTPDKAGNDCSIEDVTNRTYSIYRADRLLLLADYPSLLTYEEEAMLSTAFRCEGLKGKQGKLKASLLEESWDLIEAVAAGKRSFDDLPETLREG
jgi:hypothetical protein